MVRTPTRPQAQRIRLRDQSLCVYCPDNIGAVFDHVLPWKHGGPTIDGNLVMACVACNMKKKGDLNEAMMTQAFKHLLDVGESLQWVDKILGTDTAEIIIEDSPAPVTPLFQLPAPRQVTAWSSAASVLTPEKQARRARHGRRRRLARQLRQVLHDIDDLQKGEGITKSKILKDFKEMPEDGSGSNMADSKIP